MQQLGEHLNWMTRNYYPVKKSGQSSINWLDKSQTEQ